MNEQKFVTEKVEAFGAGIADTVNELIKDAKPLIHEASERLTELTKESLAAANKGKLSIEIKGHDLVDQAVQTIKQEPFKAMFIAAGIGAATVALISLLTRPNLHHKND